MKKLLILLFIFLQLFISCKKDDDIKKEITPEQARDSLYYLMKSVYYWYKLAPSVTRQNYTDPYTLMGAMKYKPLDRWSFVADYDEFNSVFKGNFVGHGYSIGLDNASVARIEMIYNNSPLYAEGVRRGWIVKKINNVDVAPLLIAANYEAYSALLGPRTEGIENTFVFQKPDGSEVTIVSKKKSFTANSVILCETLNLSSGVTGHIVFESFIEPSETELKDAFAFLKSSGVKDLILDLRYNSGGYLYIAQILASYIAGNSRTGETFARLEYNDRYTAYNESYKFITTSYPLSLPRLIVITSRSTASASEDIINGLKPFINIISIGDTTDGKPVGMLTFPCAEKYIFSPIVSKIVNSLNQGDFYDGFAPHKTATDDITHDFSSREETCLKEAILYLETGAFSGKGKEAFSRSVQFSEKPYWMNNAFEVRK
jgi:carboxyl-terminal processing protease